MAICVPTYTLGGVLTAYFGLSVSEALWTILVANFIVLIPLTLNAFPGTRYGIPCPVVLRASFGIIGSNVPSLIRAIVACGWFGVQTCLAVSPFICCCLRLFDSWAALGGTGEVLGFFIFWVANILVVIRGSESIKHLETLAAPLLLIVAIGLIVWALPKVTMSRGPGRAREPARGFILHQVLHVRANGDGGILGNAVTEYSRLQSLRPVAAQPGHRSDYRAAINDVPVLGAWRRADRRVIGAGGETVSDPINLIGHIDSPVWVVLSMLMIILATISTNTAANIVSPTNSFQNIAPRTSMKIAAC